ncbi:MAG: ferredoxin [Candidatus Omnitrophica bacterium CG11_big_fil_rev_8_21_14_0_20_42_13]|uniref:Ferredoxin n=1 Tax=Candidatus Ghiorseimicrobium undicola TaxID=1974746 RepID=A0A2H0LWH4_9BACT|nr:MAG: ferredoxin [Candidatus Omnitrophica bacterium CG11_big_fil_rev_8_21_14_0_20_42_13]
MKAIVDQEACTGCGLCEQTCPEVFEMDGDKAKVMVEFVPDGSRDCAVQAADECPASAISIEE